MNRFKGTLALFITCNRFQTHTGIITHFTYVGSVASFSLFPHMSTQLCVTEENESVRDRAGQ